MGFIGVRGLGGLGFMVEGFRVEGLGAQPCNCQAVGLE